MVPVEHRPTLLFGRLPLAGDAANHGRQVRLIRGGIGHDLQVEDGGRTRPTGAEHGREQGVACVREAHAG